MHPQCSGQPSPSREDDVRAVVQHEPSGAAYARESARATREIGKSVRPRRASLSRQHHRNRSRRVCGVASRQRHDSLQRHGRLDGQRFSVFNAASVLRAYSGIDGRLRSAHQRRRRRKHRRTLGRSRDLSRALLGALRRRRFRRTSRSPASFRFKGRSVRSAASSRNCTPRAKPECARCSCRRKTRATSTRAFSDRHRAGDNRRAGHARAGSAQEIHKTPTRALTGLARRKSRA